MGYDQAACVLGCVETHTEKRYGRWQRGSREEFGILVKRDGRPSHRMRCLACGRMSSDLPLNQACRRHSAAVGHEWHRRMDGYAWHRKAAAA